MNVQANDSPLVAPHTAALRVPPMASEQFWMSRLGCAMLVLAGLVGSLPTSFAQVSPATAPASAQAGGKTAATGLNWSQLSPSQQQVLAPLAPTWNTGMSEPQKRKWLEISKNSGGLTPQAQATLNSRMKEWVGLTPQERAQARLNFGKTNELAGELTPEEKKAKWEAYQALTPDEKQKLAATASPRPAGAATAVKPVAPQKLAAVPFQAASQPAGPTGRKLAPSPPPARAASAPSPATPASATPQR